MELSKEAEAKAAWLAGNGGKVVPTAATGTMTEEQAKAAWLAKLDAPTWGQ